MEKEASKIARLVGSFSTCCAAAFYSATGFSDAAVHPQHVPGDPSFERRLSQRASVAQCLETVAKHAYICALPASLQLTVHRSSSPQELMPILYVARIMLGSFGSDAQFSNMVNVLIAPLCFGYKKISTISVVV